MAKVINQDQSEGYVLDFEAQLGAAADTILRAHGGLGIHVGLPRPQLRLDSTFNPSHLARGRGGIRDRERREKHHYSLLAAAHNNRAMPLDVTPWTA